MKTRKLLNRETRGRALFAVVVFIATVTLAGSAVTGRFAVLIIGVLAIREISGMKSRANPSEQYYAYEKYVYRGLVASVMIVTGVFFAYWMYARDPSFVLVVVLATYLNDAAAYVFGRTYGGRWIGRSFYRYSPSKTWEGTLGGALTTLVAGTGIGVHACLAGELRWWAWPAICLLSAIGAIVGDCVGSSLKRFIGVKDSSARSELWLGHGGWTDRFLAVYAGLAVSGLLIAVY